MDTVSSFSLRGWAGAKAISNQPHLLCVCVCDRNVEFYSCAHSGYFQVRIPLGFVCVRGRGPWMNGLSLKGYCIPRQRQVLTGYRPPFCLTTRPWGNIRIGHVSPCASVWIWHVRLHILSVFVMNRDVLARWVSELDDADDDDDDGMMMRTMEFLLYVSDSRTEPS